MSTTKLIIRKDRINSFGTTLIYLQYCYESKIKLFSTKEKIDPKHWNTKEQKVKKSYPGYSGLNTVLSKEKERLDNFIREAKFRGINPDFNYITSVFQKQEIEVKEVDFFAHFEAFIDLSKSVKSKATIINYQVVFNHLKRYQDKTGEVICFSEINQTFYSKLIKHFTAELNHSANTIGRNIMILKVFLNHAANSNLISAEKFRKFKVFNEETDLVYLTEDEVLTLYNLELEGVYSFVRDLFCLSCFTGLRFSDVTSLKKENIKGDSITIRTQKTNQTLVIPLNQFSKNILNRLKSKTVYNRYKLTNYRFNELLAEIAKLATIDEEIILTSKKGGQKVEKKFRKYELIKSHTGRRTFITLSLEKGMRAEVLMKITGIKNPATLKRYIKIVDKVKDAEMKKAWD